MKTTKAYLIFSLPALFLHELSHLLMCILTLTQPCGFSLNLLEGHVRYLAPRNYLINLLINLSPFLNFLLAFFLIIINPLFVFFLVYLLLTIGVSLPSKFDYENIRNYGKCVDF